MVRTDPRVTRVTKESAKATVSKPQDTSDVELGEHAIEQRKQMTSKGVEGLLAYTVAEMLLDKEHVVDTVFGCGRVSMNDHVPLSGQGVELVLALTNMRLIWVYNIADQYRGGTYYLSDVENFGRMSANKFALKLYSSRGPLMFQFGGDHRSLLARGDGEKFESAVHRYLSSMKSPQTMVDDVSAGLSDELKKLAELRASGVLSEEEFRVAKRKLLSG